MTTEYTNQAPEGSAVTISTQTTVLDGALTGWRYTNLLYTDSIDKKTFVLDYWPADPRAQQVLVNSQGQRYGVDYTIAGNVLTLTTALSNPDDYVYVSGMAILSGEDLPNPSGIPVGSKMLWLSTGETTPVPPPGWLVMASATYLKADYPILWAWLDSLSPAEQVKHFTGETATEFTLVPLATVVGTSVIIRAS